MHSVPSAASCSRIAGHSQMPHLYRHFDSSGSLLYVGQSLSAINRLSQHKDCSHWFNQIAVVKIEHFQRREEVLAAERTAIIKENPRFNVKRPKEVLQKPQHVIDAENAKRGLTRSVVFHPMYGKNDLARVLLVSGNAVERLWNENKLGFVVAGVKRGSDKPLRMTTGWQLISYIESLA